MEGSAKERRVCEKNGTARGASSSHTSTEGHKISTSSGYDYEVFLSFRGPDTRERFTDFLYTSLKDAGIRTFKDSEDLRKGEDFGPELLQAINESKISIPIFSKNYAASIWCLKELLEMVKCQKTRGQKIMPIFYDVAPSEVRHQIGCYGQAFLSHEKNHRYGEETMRQWKDALREVSFLNGWDLHSKTDRREGEFAKTVTQEVFNKLKKAYLEVSDYLVSVDHHVDEIMKKIGAQTSDTRIVVIYGMGGVGKSTIAKIIYNQLSNNFKNFCFLSNIRELSKSKGIEWLQHQLISEVLKMKQTDAKDKDEGTQTIKCRLARKQVLLLLDDVHEKKDMDALVGKRNWFGKGSKLIITTRNKDIINVPVVDDHYEVSVMDPVQSLQLFSKHAFRRDSPLDNYINQSNRAIEIAGCLPLALEVIGSLLSCTKKEKWDLILKKLESVPPEEVRNKLKISYDALDFRQKDIFLDIACLFIGYDKDIMVHFWDESKFPEEAMEVLQNMSLIKIKEDNKVWMHDQLRDIGREIVRQKSKTKVEKQSRVWDPKQAMDLLKRREEKNKVEALRLKFDHGGQYHFTYEGFIRLSNLRFLAVDGSIKKFRAEQRLLWHESPSNVFQENSDLLPQLRWLSWCDIPLTFNITNFSMENVVILDLSGSQIRHDWKGWSHMEVMENLKVLNLTNCHFLERTPAFSAPANIERLILQGCKALTDIDRSICQLKCLVYLNASSCENLCRLPDELGEVARLEYLYLSRCGLLERLPDSTWNLESLIELDINYTGIKELPKSIRKLKNLKVVRLCSRMSKIPDALWMIEKLEKIEYNRENLPGGHVKVGKGISESKSLRILRLSLANIHALPTLPESLITLELSSLCMDKFPDLSNLSNLKELVLTFASPDLEEMSNGPPGECPMPRWFEKLSKLESLSLHSDYVTTSPTDVSLPPQLTRLSLWCPNLCCLPRLPSGLSSLYLYDCKSLCSMGDLSNLKRLSSLKVTLAKIIEIQGLGCLENLRELQLDWLGQIKVLPDLSNLIKLLSLQVRSCDNMVEIQRELPPFLSIFEIYGCRSLQRLPDLSSLMMGKTNVEIIYCDKILEYACMNREELELVGFKQLQILPDLSNSNKLRRLQVERCDNLVEIQGKLPQSLSNLKISSCKSLQKLPNLSSLKKVQRVVIEGCAKLNSEAILSFARRRQANLWENLQYLQIGGFEQVEILPDLSNLNNLRHLQVENCGNLVEIQGELPESLEKLKISSCKSLRNLPDLSSLNGLRRVNIHRCYKLNVEAISSCCSERVIFVEETDHESESEGEDNEELHVADSRSMATNSSLIFEL